MTDAPVPARLYDYVQKPRAKRAHEREKPRTLNDRLALLLTRGVGTMWCAYAFALLALLVLPEAVKGGTLTLVQWISQTFIQLVMLSVIVVGQNIIGASADKRSIETYEDAEAVLYECLEIQKHLEAQDQHLIAQDAKIDQLLSRLAAQTNITGASYDRRQKEY